METRNRFYPGARVHVRSLEEIAATLDPDGCLEHMPFMPEMTSLCGKQVRVRNRVERMILETSGETREIANTVILEGITCDGHTILGGCSRHVFHLWGEAWLRRVQIQTER